MFKDNRRTWGGRIIYTRSASNVHGFEVAGFDDAHSDGVGCGVVAQRHKQIPSTPLEKSQTKTANYLLLHPVFTLFSFLFAFSVFLFLPLAICVVSIYLSASPYSLLSLLPPACCHISPESITAATNDITRYILSVSHPLSPPPPSFLPSLPHFPSYSRCHHYMVAAPSRKSAC